MTHDLRSIATVLGIALGILGIAVGFGSWGYAMGDNAGEAVVAILEQENSRLEADIRSARSEIAHLEGEIAARDASQQDAEPPAAEEPSDVVQTVRVWEGETGEAFDGEVLISLIGSDFGGSPAARYRVTAKIGTTGQENLSIVDADVGHRVHLNRYEVRLTAVDSASATFRIETLTETSEKEVGSSTE